MLNRRIVDRPSVLEGCQDNVLEFQFVRLHVSSRGFGGQIYRTKYLCFMDKTFKRESLRVQILKTNCMQHIVVGINGIVKKAILLNFHTPNTSRRERNNSKKIPTFFY